VSGRRPTLEDRLEFLLFRVVTGLLLVLPESWAIGCARALGWVAGAVLRIRRPVVDENLARAFPDKDERWRRSTAVESYRHLGAEAAATLLTIHRGLDRLRERARLQEGKEAITQALREGGAIVVSGHVGNWELLAGALAAQGLPVDAVVARQRNPLFDDELARLRERLRVRLLDRAGARGEVLRALEERRIVYMAADQDAGAGGVFVDFLGSPASTARGPAVLTLRSGARLFSAFCTTDGRHGRYSIQLEEIPVERSGDLRADVLRITREHSARLAGVVRRLPAQYFWHHKRWKTRPEPTP
jgi:KDO2-lipid IV(A) lauroyltransferase